MKKIWPKSVILTIVLVAFVVVQQAIVFQKNSDEILKPFYPLVYKEYKDLYDHSQYIQEKNPVIIPDEFDYAYAGWEYTHGSDPLLINAEQPPLGKYIIGFLEIVLNSSRVSGILFNILSLVTLFFLSKLLLKNTNWSLLVVIFFQLEKIFMVQVQYAPLLDNIQLLFILSSFVFYLLGLRKKIFFIPAFIFLGLSIATKFWITGAIILLVWILHQIIFRGKVFFQFLIFAPISLLVLFLSYLALPFHGYPLLKFLSVQKYIFAYFHQTIRFNFFSFLDLVFLNRWHADAEQVIKPSVDFQISWPVIFTILLIFVVFHLRKKDFSKMLKEPIGVIVIWVLVYILFLSFGSILARYLLPILPFLYILSLKFIKDRLAQIFST